MRATIYFDTNFYVWLAHVDEGTASATIRDLNGLGVRHVLSDLVLGELLTSAGRTHWDRLLVERVRLFDVPPYELQPGLSWNAILAEGEDRSVVASAMRRAHDGNALGDSFPLAAERAPTLPPADAQALHEAARLFLRREGLAGEDGAVDVAAFVQRLRDLDLPVPEIDWPADPSPEACQRLSQEVLAALGPGMVERLEQERALKRSATAFDRRPVEAAMGDLSHLRSLGSAFRDSEHAARFAQHEHAVDFLQVDGPQERLIRRPSPAHHLAKIGLAERCFSARSLPEVVERVRDLVDRRDATR
jgi:hypothetical protein